MVIFKHIKNRPMLARFVLSKILQKTFFLFCFFLIVIGCKEKKKPEPIDPYIWETITVKATAYNSLAYQTSSQPQIAAWGDSLKPGMKCIAVSRDLIEKGLGHNTEVKLEGFDDIFLVKDKMNYRWKNRIDIYMGVDVKKAREWGVQKIKLQYKTLRDSLKLNDSIK